MVAQVRTDPLRPTSDFAHSNSRLLPVDQPSPADSAQVDQLGIQLRNRILNDPQAFRNALRQSLGEKADYLSINQLIELVLNDQLPIPVNVIFVDHGVLGANAFGAYDASNGGTIFLDRSLLNNPSKLEAVYTEEMGHHFDALLGGPDAAGDEGALFASYLLGDHASASSLNMLRLENDTGVVDFNGRSFLVEFSIDEAVQGKDDTEVTSNDTNDSSSTGDHNNEDNSDEIKEVKPPAPVPVNQPPIPGIQPVVAPVPVRQPPITGIQPAKPPVKSDEPLGGDGDGDGDTSNGSTAAAGTVAGATAGRVVERGFWASVGDFFVSAFSRIPVPTVAGTATAGMGFGALVYPSALGGGLQSHNIPGTNASVESHGDEFTGIVSVGGVSTGIEVIEVVDENGPTGRYQATTEEGAQQLTELGIDVDPQTGEFATEGADVSTSSDIPEDQMHLAFPDPVEPEPNQLPPTSSPIDLPDVTQVDSTMPDTETDPPPSESVMDDPSAPVNEPQSMDAIEPEPTVLQTPIEPEQTPTVLPGPPVDTPVTPPPVVYEGESNEGSSTDLPMHPTDPDDLILERDNADREQLRNNLAEDFRLNDNAASSPPLGGDGKPLSGYEAHHIIPLRAGGEPIQRLREKLEGWGIDINSVNNGIYLPRKDDIPNPDGRTPHNHTRRQSYFDYLAREFRGVNTRNQALAVLDKIKSELLEGKPDLPLKPRIRTLK